MSQISDVSAIERLENFLRNKNQPTQIEQITSDASTREYFRVKWNEADAIACVYPFNELCQGQFDACLDVTKVFQTENLPVAEIFAFDEINNVIVHEDFGNKILRDVLENSDEQKRDELLNQAISLIAKIQKATDKAFELDSIASRLKFDETKLGWELNFFKEHYFETLMKKPLDKTDDENLQKEFTGLARELEQYATVLTHRDFHAANLMVGNDGQLKIIDHQDARLGSLAYDPVSLLLDRITVPPTQEWLKEKRSYFLQEREKLGLEKVDYEQFDYEFELMTVQRCLKAIGTFSFQAANRGKINFIKYINPMFEVVLGASERLQRFPNLQKIIKNILESQ